MDERGRDVPPWVEPKRDACSTRPRPCLSATPSLSIDKESYNHASPLRCGSNGASPRPAELPTAALETFESPWRANGKLAPVRAPLATGFRLVFPPKAAVDIRCCYNAAPFPAGRRTASLMVAGSCSSNHWISTGLPSLSRVARRRCGCSRCAPRRDHCVPASAQASILDILRRTIDAMPEKTVIEDLAARAEIAAQCIAGCGDPKPPRLLNRDLSLGWAKRMTAIARGRSSRHHRIAH
jgi:hypothetical protein